MGQHQKGYVRTYKQKEGYGFCVVHGLDQDDDYSSVFFHISEVEGKKGVSKDHVSWGDVSKSEDGWKMTGIKAKYAPDERLPLAKKRRKSPTEDEPYTKQADRPTPSQRSKNNNAKDGDSKKSGNKRSSVKSKEEDEEKSGGRWKGDKWIPK